MSEITNPNTAKAVIAAAKENDIWESSIPSDEKQLLADANFILEQAEAAWDNHIRGPAVTAVKFAAQVDGAHTGKSIEPDNQFDYSGETVQTTKAAIERFIEDNDLEAVEYIRDAEEAGKARKGVLNFIELQLKDAYNEPDETGEIESGDRGEDKGSGAVSPWSEPPAQISGPHPQKVHADEIELISDETWAASKKSRLDEAFEAESFGQAQAKKLNLPVPEAVDDIPAATLSRGVANLTIQDLAERLTDASLCLAAATWQTALAEIDVEHAKRVGNHYFNKEFPKAQENAKNKDAAVAKVEEIEEVKAWRAKEAEAENRYITFRALKEIYKGTYDTVSRVFAMKQEERERS